MSNALKNETSPYLLQHADNPVDWHPWNDATLAEARETGKPILLSIGYSACHWCHVMAHESFEDPETAELMNRLYVNIKVDREERPDLDRVYQLAQQLFTGRPGGWPLTVFLTPDDHIPIFAGTYFPREAAYGMPSFRDVLTRVESYFRTHREEIVSNGARLVGALDTLHWGVGPETAEAASPFSREPLDEARRLLGESFDAKFGGFGGAPKFPHATNLDFLLAAWHRSRAEGSTDAGAATMIERTLTQMAAGGLYDHLGGGFFRYSVDARWDVPHFEKMLYDNAALLATYADAFAATGRALYARVAGETADWVLRDMQDPRGGFYSTLDADSEGHEGRFYLFTPDDFDRLLTPEEASAAKARFGLDGAPNFEGSWHLRIDPAAPEPPAAAADALARARAKLFAAREQRVRPGRDEKCLVAWNGLMIAALARAARRLGRPELAEAAARAVDFIRRECWRDGRLLASFKDGRARFPAYLDDYAFLAAGLVELMQARFRIEDLGFARELLETLLAHFGDPAGGFFFTADDHEALIHRPKPSADEALPSGNGVAVLAFDTLGHLLGEADYLAAARRALAAALPAIAAHPQAHATMLAGIGRQLEPPELVVVRADAASLASWRREIDRDYDPGRLAFFIPDDAGPLPGLLAERTAGDDGARAYVCTGTECRAPLTSLAALRAALGMER